MTRHDSKCQRVCESELRMFAQDMTQPRDAGSGVFENKNKIKK